MAKRRNPDLSCVVPLFNEESTLVELHERLRAVLDGTGRTYEVIYVDDGSTDGTYSTADGLRRIDDSIRIVKLARNFGQTAALAAGFDHARGSIITAMDGDLQHAPEDLPRLLAKLDEGYDIVSGWRERRVDGYWTRRVPSRIANRLIARVSGVALHDFGTTFKVYRAATLKKIRLYGDLHRFIPALASWHGARIAEVPISNIERPKNQSHYGLSRTWRVLADLITVRFLLRYATRPLHVFGPLGFFSLTAGSAAGLYVAVKKLAGESVFLAHGPLLLLSVVLIQAGVLLIALGVMAELLTRIYFEGDHRRRIYSVARIADDAELDFDTVRQDGDLPAPRWDRVHDD